MAGSEGGPALGNDVLAAEMTRRQWRGGSFVGWLEGASADLRFAARLARRRPVRIALALLVLTLGIGGTTAIYTVVNAVLVRPLPYPGGARLVAISSRYPSPGGGRIAPTVTLNEVERWRGAARSWVAIGSFVFSANAINVGNLALEPVTAGVDPEFLRTLGVSPAMGRNFNGSGSSRPSASVIISQRLWMEGFAGDRHVIGRTLKFEGSPMVVVGVLPEGFQFPRSDASYFAEDPDVLYPVANIAKAWGRDSAQWFAIGRLRPGASAAAAQSELNALTRGLAGANPGERDITPV
ncbi:MAG: ABC transporter permease, partial [Streptosporangiaceae bacterium]